MSGEHVMHVGAATRIAALVQRERSAGRAVIVVPAGGDKSECLALFGEVLHFPEWYGHNYDALHDCIGNWAHERSEPWTLIWDGAAQIRATDPRTYEVVADILDQLVSPDGWPPSPAEAGRRAQIRRAIIVDR